MQVFYDYQQIPQEMQGGIVTIGNFDGVHRGHQALIHRLQQQQACYRNNRLLQRWRQNQPRYRQLLNGESSEPKAEQETEQSQPMLAQPMLGQAPANRRVQQSGFKTLVVLFEPQPKEFFCPEQAPKRIYSLEQKLQVLKRLKVDGVLVLTFDDTLRYLNSEDFIQQVLLDGLRIHHLVIGDDFRFGNDRKGDFNLLQQAAEQHGFVLEKTPTVLDAVGDRISSTLIRECLHQGNKGRARELMGRTSANHLLVA